jgi:hypothetical protein
MRTRVRGTMIAATLLSWAVSPLSSQQNTAGGSVYTYFEPPATCKTAAVREEVAKVQIKTDGFQSGMISPDAAKTIALCWVPGQIGSGEIESNETRSVYEITVLPNKKKTYSKIIIDAYTGQVLSTKQFGGARGYAGFLRESAERKTNKAKQARDTTRPPM